VTDLKTLIEAPELHGVIADKLAEAEFVTEE
jgi:hypothetical protein